MANKTIKADKLQEVIMKATLNSISGATAETPAKKSNKKAAAKATPKVTVKKETKETKAKATSSREAKYIYPSDCTSTLDRKKFRAEFRTKAKSYESRLSKAKAGSKEYKSIFKEYQEYKAKYLRG